MSKRDTKPPALLIGRWLTPHEGHLMLIREAIERYGSVVIAFRNTTEQPAPHRRMTLMMKFLCDNNVDPWLFRFILLPDVSAVVYGRDVGYDLCEIRFDEATEAISGTVLRG